MKLSVIIPVYNEEKTLREVLERVLRVDLDKEILIVDDGSTDATRGVIAEYSNRPEVRGLFHERNRGKGAAIRTGIGHVAGDIIVIQDADLEYDPDDLPAVVAPIAAGRTGVVYGSRVLGPSTAKSAWSFYLGGKFLSWLTNTLYGSSITDEPTCYKAFRTDLLRSIPLECTGFEFCPEVTAKILKRGYPIHEVPIRYTPRSRRDGKKIRWTDGMEAVWVLVKYRFTG
jgi:glycosyltransferase involved in cell wall biosynthesis